MVEDGELAALVPEVGLRLVQPLQHQHLVKDGQRRGEHLIKYRAATTLTEVAKEVSCTWQTCGSGVAEVDHDGDGGDSECGDDVMTIVMVVVMVITCRAMMGAVTCLSNGNLWKSIGQSMSKLMREEYLWF